ncbi:MAG: TOBE domain-containing protein, partial [Sphingobacteriales bacterium]
EVSCIFVTHDVSDAYGMADHLAVMRKGKILQLDAPHKVYQQPMNQYVAEITGDVNIVSNEWLASVGLTSQTNTFIRPEQITVSTSSALKAKIVSVKFLGSYYEVMLKAEGQELRMFSFEALKTGDEIGIEIRQ